MELGDKIKELRLQRKMRQSELAEKANISRVAVGNYERNERIPTADVLCKICVALDIPPNQLLEWHLFGSVKSIEIVDDYLNLLGFIVSHNVSKWHYEEKDDGSQIQVSDMFEHSITKDGNTATFTDKEFNELKVVAKEAIEDKFYRKLWEQQNK